MEKAIYSLVATMIGRMIYGWSKGYYFRYKMFRQLKAEVIILHKSLADNRTRIDGNTDDNSFPLLKRLELLIHEKLISEYILDDEVSSLASQLISNCHHYNRIIELGEKDSNKRLRKAEVVNQGSLIFNEPPHLFYVNGGERTPYISQTKKYIEILDQRVMKYRHSFRFFPWYLLLIQFENDDPTSNVA